jgi:hypothetical protein
MDLDPLRNPGKKVQHFTIFHDLLPVLVRKNIFINDHKNGQVGFGYETKLFSDPKHRKEHYAL